ncbi:PREDICTED: tetratricopeptide repeat protein 25-like [Ceratosolen solmsi marchali]|uniref:Tetratricopeptide repeat protein 25-like n=1 Tax=Ceratosolen solmsi marchali TaxID=326594 RepID=A0AAJ7DWA8_9HYME|nr:PREDICTED: tetratricopeptide repeat protein 25-like [Ceratosolen solmsi marchali]
MAQLLNDDEENQIFHAQILYREWGRRFTVLHKFLKGIEYYKKSTEYGDQNFIITLMRLSEVLMKSGQFTEASTVAEKCREIDPTNVVANYTRMEALFAVAEFCRSLVYAQQGARQRMTFRFAVLLANETIEDCVGANVSSTMMRYIQPWITKLREHREEVLERLNDLEDELEGIGDEHTRFKISDSQAKLQKYRTEHDHLMALMYLGGTCHDKRFLQELLHRPALASANKAGSLSLLASINKSLTRSQSQQEALRTRRPLYAVNARTEAAKTPGRRFALYQELLHRRCLAKQDANYLFKQLHLARLRRDYPFFFKMVDLVKDKLESYGRQLLPDIYKLMDVLSRMVARVYMDPRNLKRFCNESEEERTDRLRQLLGIRTARMLRDSDLAWIPSYDVKKALNVCNRRLSLTKHTLEVLWIFHELCKLFLEVRRYDLARFYAKKTRELSLNTGYEEWAVNASHVLIRVELVQSNRNEAREAAMAALQSAQNLNVDFLVDFYERTIVLINGLDFDRLSDNNSIAARQRLILQIIPTDQRPKMDLLLRSMDAVSASRRLSIMPGCKPREATGQSTKKTVASTEPKNYEKELRNHLLKKFSPNTKILGRPNINEFN